MGTLSELPGGSGVRAFSHNQVHRMGGVSEWIPLALDNWAGGRVNNQSRPFTRGLVQSPKVFGPINDASN